MSNPYQPNPYQPVHQTSTTVVTQRQLYSGGHIAIAWVLTVLTLGYLLPWAIAVTRQRPNITGLVLIDIFLGWSLVGWIVSLVMACSDDRSSVVVVNHTTYGPGYAQPPAPYGTAHPYQTPYSAPSASDPRAVGWVPPATDAWTQQSRPSAQEPTAPLPWSDPNHPDRSQWR